MILTDVEADAIQARVAEVESRTGAQVVTALVPRSDDYPEIGWKAFAMGAVIAALLVVVFDVLYPDWMSSYALWSNVTPILGVGAASALLAFVLPAYARLYLNRVRSAGEVRQRAQQMFVERQLFSTHARNGILLLASVFERRVELLADIGYRGRIDETEWQRVVGAMTPHLARAQPAEALLRGLREIETLLASKGVVAERAVDNELPDRPIET